MTTFNKKSIFFIIVLVLLLGFGAHNNRHTPAKELSPGAYESVKEEFVGMVHTHDPKFALTELRERIKTDDTLLRSCHTLVHDIGRAAYEKYDDFGKAMQYQDEICNSGYLHGIIEIYFRKSADALLAMKTVCDAYPLGKYLSWECYHGVGHGLMYYTLNDLPKSLELCGTYETAFARENCTNGVFMENFNTDQKLHPSLFLHKNDPFYPCQEQTSGNKRMCYPYASTYYLSLHKNDYVGALQWCMGAEPLYENMCILGVGGQAIKEHISDPKFVESICMSGELSWIAPCISGMVGLYINHSGSLSPAKKLCEQLEVSNRKICYRTIEQSATLF